MEKHAAIVRQNAQRFLQTRAQKGGQIREAVIIPPRFQTDGLVAPSLEAHPIPFLIPYGAQAGAPLRLARIEGRINVDQIDGPRRHVPQYREIVAEIDINHAEPCKNIREFSAAAAFCSRAYPPDKASGIPPAKTFTFIMTHIWFYAISKKTGDSKMHCRKCGSEAFTKNGFVAGTQRYKCKQCGFQFTRETSHGKPMKDKILALILYLSGMSMNMIGKIVGVSTQSVMRWINMFYEKFAANDESQSNIEEIEVDEMVSYITKKKITSGSGKLLIITLENLSAGNVVIVVPKP